MQVKVIFIQAFMNRYWKKSSAYNPFMYCVRTWFERICYRCVYVANKEISFQKSENSVSRNQTAYPGSTFNVSRFIYEFTSWIIIGNT